MSDPQSRNYAFSRISKDIILKKKSEINDIMQITFFFQVVVPYNGAKYSAYQYRVSTNLPR